MSKYLDGNGLRYLWGKILAGMTGKQDRLTGAAGQVVGFDADGRAVAQGTESLVGPMGPQGEKGDKGDAGPAGPQGAKGDSGLFYGTCGTAAEAASKVVTLAGFTLAAGAVAAVEFTYGNTAASPTLNVNGTGAKSIAVCGGTAAGPGAWADGEVVLFVFDGARWLMVSGAALGAGSGGEMYTGSYAGDGTDSLTLAFPKLPVIVFVWCSVFPTSPAFSFIVDGALYAAGGGTSKMTVNGNSVTWNKYGSSSFMLQRANATYRYLAFAQG